MNNAKWEEKYNEATERADFFEPNTLVIPINSAILLTRMLLTESTAQAIAEDRERVRGEIEKQFGDFLLKNWSGEEEVYSEIDRLKTDLLSSLDKPLTDK